MFLAFPGFASWIMYGTSPKSFIFSTAPLDGFLGCFLENIQVWLFSYSAAWLIFFSNEMLNRFKFNPKYPARLVVLTEIARSFRGVLVVTVFDVLISMAVQSGRAPNLWIAYKSTDVGSVEKLTLMNVCAWLTVVALWGDFHFYITHRIMHQVGPLYRWVHKVHHWSINPDPWSGISMHPVEQAIYFSAMFLFLAVPMPFWAHRVTKLGLIVFPIPGHLNHFVDHHHYIHHTRFNFNFGSTPLFDHVFGTADADWAANTNAAQLAAAKRQELLAKADVAISEETKRE